MREGRNELPYVQWSVVDEVTIWNKQHYCNKIRAKNEVRFFFVIGSCLILRRITGHFNHAIAERIAGGVEIITGEREAQRQSRTSARVNRNDRPRGRRRGRGGAAPRACLQRRASTRDLHTTNGKKMLLAAIQFTTHDLNFGLQRRCFFYTGSSPPPSS